MTDPALDDLAIVLKDLYRLSGSARLHADMLRATGVAVSRSGLRFLSLIADAGPISATRLAEVLDLTQSTGSRVLQQLAADGLVTRRASNTDGRVSEVVVTDLGHQLLRKVHRYHVRQLATALADVDEVRRRALADAVTELVLRLHGRDRASSRRSA